MKIGVVCCGLEPAAVGLTNMIASAITLLIIATIRLTIVR
jgi:hypothetical protein